MALRHACYIRLESVLVTNLLQLWNGKRELEWQGEVSLIDKSKKGGKSLYLFTDLCLFGSLKQKKFHVKHVILLNELTITPDPMESSVELSFKKTKLVLAFDRLTDRNKFIELIRELTTPLKKQSMSKCHLWSLRIYLW